MTKPAVPPPAADDELIEVEVVEVEIDAMDVREWEQHQRTPQASDANLAALVRESKKSLEPVAEDPPRKMPLVPRGRVTGLLSPQPPRPVETPAPSGALAETPAPPIEQITPFAPTPAMGTPISKPDGSYPGPDPGPYPRAVPDPTPPWPEPGARRGGRERQPTLKTRSLLAVAASRRKVLWIGGTAGFVALVAVLMLMGGRRSSAVATSVRAEERAPDSAASARDAVAAPAAHASPPARTAALDPSAARPSAAAPTPAKPPKLAASAIRPGPRPAKQLGGKKLVVEYVERASEVPPPSLVAQAAEDPAVGRARRAYLSGNQKLFAGDADRAILAYRQALILYPGYVGGYRGLGLAYAQLGEPQKALEAFRTYMTAVPNAKDIALIKKRIARLQGK